MTGAEALVAGLRAHGVDRVFCVAGESYLALLDALYGIAAIDVVTCRHEGSAGFMAIADAKLTGRAGVCLVHRGPGATNASIAVHAAAQDATPLVLLVGHVETRQIGRDAFQELDCVRMFSGLAKAVWVVHDPADAPELLARAFRAAESGTPGPAVLALPEDVLARSGAAATPAPAREEPLAPAQPAVERILALLAEARRPLLLAGGRLASRDGRDALLACSERHSLPVATSNKHQDVFDNRHAHYAGHLHNTTRPRQLETFDRADLVLAVGTRLDEVTTRGGRFPRAPVPDQPLVHVYPDPGRLGAVHRPALSLACDPVELVRALARRPPARLHPERLAWIEELHAIETRNAQWDGAWADDGVVVGDVVATLERLTQGEAVVIVDSGTFTSWVYRYFRFARTGTLLGISSSAMGFGVPAAVASALRVRDVPTVAVVGDGGFLMNGGELATAVAQRLPLVVVVSNNGSYGTIRLHQERAYPGRCIATDLVNPDFALLAEAYGAGGETVSAREELEPVLAAALGSGGPVVVDVATSLSWVTPYERIETVSEPIEALDGRR